MGGTRNSLRSWSPTSSATPLAGADEHRRVRGVSPRVDFTGHNDHFGRCQSEFAESLSGRTIRPRHASSPVAAGISFDPWII